MISSDEFNLIGNNLRCIVPDGLQEGVVDRAWGPIFGVLTLTLCITQVPTFSYSFTDPECLVVNYSRCSRLYCVSLSVSLSGRNIWVYIPHPPDTETQ